MVVLGTHSHWLQHIPGSAPAQRAQQDHNGSKWDHNGITLGSHQDHNGITMRSKWDHNGIMKGSHQAHCGLTVDHNGITLGSHQDHSGITMRSKWDHNGITTLGCPNPNTALCSPNKAPVANPLMPLVQTELLN